jgi:hypothetical protein
LWKTYGASCEQPIKKREKGTRNGEKKHRKSEKKTGHEKSILIAHRPFTVFPRRIHGPMRGRNRFFKRFSRFSTDLAFPATTITIFFIKL